MIIYKTTKKEFLNKIDCNVLVDEVVVAFYDKLHKNPGHAEKISWENSLRIFSGSLRNATIPDDIGVAIEYQMPLGAKRIDVTLSGIDEIKSERLLIIELKQWSKADSLVNSNDIVTTWVGGGNRNVAHPSRQALIYKVMLDDFVEYIDQKQIEIDAIVYMHNMEKATSILNSEKYDSLTRQAPIYYHEDSEALSNYISSLFYSGDAGQLIDKIDNSPQRPSKQLKDEIKKIFDGSDLFHLVEDQLLAVEEIYDLAVRTKLDKEKKVYIIKGEPGTGKTLVALKAIYRLFEDKTFNYNVLFVSKNAAVRDVYKKTLGNKIENIKNADIKFENLFKGSSSFTGLNLNKYDVLLIDEAHRLVPKSQFRFSSLKDQVKEIITEAMVSVFFIDETQEIEFSGIGTVAHIRNCANSLGVADENIIMAEPLTSQFRSMGSNGYLDLIDNIFYNKNLPISLEFTKNFDLKVFDSAEQMRLAIKEKNKIGRSRMVAGYCWNWVTKGLDPDSKIYDIEIDDFKMKWNLDNGKMDWLALEDSDETVGCIHTVQGLEMEYCGVIIGDDLLFENNQVTSNYKARAKTDKSLNGGIGLITGKKIDSLVKKEAVERVDRIIRNTYKVLLSRGIKGVYIYCTNKELNDYLKSVINQNN